MQTNGIRFIRAGLAVVAIVLASCASGASVASSPALAPEYAAGDEGNAGSEDRIEFKGISFALPHSLNGPVVPERVKVRPLGSPTDKPDWVAPGHIAFPFGGAYGKRFEGSFFTATLNVYPIEEYRKQLSVQKTTLAEFDLQLSRLRRLLQDKISPPGNDELPLLKYVDASEQFHAHVKYTEFSKGRGLVFLTQYNTEPALINNKGLTYIFQGVTNDGRYYVLGTFPVSAPFLPDSYEETTTVEYEVPLTSFSEADKAKYDDYVLSTKGKLEGTPDGGFHPSLKAFDRIISTLKIGQ